MSLSTAIRHERSTPKILTLCPPSPFAGLSNGLLIASIVSLSLKSLLLLTVTLSWAYSGHDPEHEICPHELDVSTTLRADWIRSACLLNLFNARVANLRLCYRTPK